MKLFSTPTTTVVVALAALAVSPASSSMDPPPEYSSLPKLDKEKMRTNFLFLISPHHQRMLQGGVFDEVEFSLKCQRSLEILMRNNVDEPLAVFDFQAPYDAETNTVDFAAYPDLLDNADSYCNNLGAQTIIMDFELSDGCDFNLDGEGFVYNILNLPDCWGSACDEDDAEKMGNFRASFFETMLGGFEDSNSCTVSVTAVEADGDGEPFGPPCITNECLDDSFNLYNSDDVYGEDWNVILDEGDGYDTGVALANFEESCENESGRVVVASVTYENDGYCSGPASKIISKPLCFAKSCGDEARIVEEFVRETELFGCGYGNATITVEEEFGSKSSKSSKKSSKSNKKSKKCGKESKSSLRKGRK